MCEDFKSSMMLEFDMSGKMRYFLGIEVLQNERGIFICQQKYAREVLARFGMEESNAVGSPILLYQEQGRSQMKKDQKWIKQCLSRLLDVFCT